MTVYDYNALAIRNPELHLPYYHDLNPISRELVHLLSKERLIARRVARLLGRKDPAVPEPDEILVPEN